MSTGNSKPDILKPGAPKPSTSDPDLDNLGKIEHIIVLMLENRTFDHMLGYLSLPTGMGGAGRTDVDGLAPQMSNTLSQTGQVFPVHHLESSGQEDLPSTIFPVDPPHSHGATKRQINDTTRDMSGFVDDFHRAFQGRADPSLIMGYHDAADVPMYDFLAEMFCICDRWFSSFRGSTWVNRLFALAGQAFGETDNRPPYSLNVPPHEPPYFVPSGGAPTFFRLLDERRKDWACYAHDFSSLRAVDGRYAHTEPLGGTHFRSMSRFFKDVEAGTLPPVSWVDPNFNDVAGDLAEMEQFPFTADQDYPFFPFAANDDHPPTDVRHAQQLLLEMYAALVMSPLWSKTLFVCTYDEHGGFYDHVSPPELAPDAIDLPPQATPQEQQALREAYQYYGVRVPELVISPWVKRRSVSSTVFDHTSIIKTILLKFCRDVNGNIPHLSNRVDRANHLGGLLSEPSPRADTLCSVTNAVGQAVLREYLHTSLARVREQGMPLKPQGVLTDLQRDILTAREALSKQQIAAVL